MHCTNDSCGVFYHKTRCLFMRIVNVVLYHKKETSMKLFLRKKLF